MVPNEDITTTQGLAVVALLLLLLVPLAVALAVWLKQRYAHAVVLLQASTCGVLPAHAESPMPHPSMVSAPLTELQQQLTAADAIVPGQIDPTRVARRLRAWVLAVQFASGLLYWWMLLLVMVVGLAYFAQVTGQDDTSKNSTSAVAMHLVLWPLLVLPAALAWAFQAGVRESRVWTVSAIILGSFGIGLALAGTGWLVSGGFVLFCALLASMLVAFMRPAVRGAGPPLVVAFTVGFLVLSLLLWLATMLDNSPEDTISTSDWILGLSVVALMLAAAAYAAWRMLKRLAARYTRKLFSEQQVALGAYWGLITLFAATAVLLLSFEQRTAASMEWLALAIGLTWLCWRVCQRWTLRMVLRRAPESLGALLLLRVFKPSQRTEAFTDRFLARWRFAAPVWMIAGPDLAGACMEPDEFFSYLSGRLRERFLTDPTRVNEALAVMDNGRDPDGRFRVNELFCTNSTWQPAVLALMQSAGVVLLDLREYTHQRAGTRFELAELLRRAPLHKVLVVLGQQDDAQQVQQEIGSIWQQVGGANTHVPTHPSIQLITLGEGSDAEMRGLFYAAAQAASASPNESMSSHDGQGRGSHPGNA